MPADCLFNNDHTEPLADPWQDVSSTEQWGDRPPELTRDLARESHQCDWCGYLIRTGAEHVYDTVYGINCCSVTCAELESQVGLKVGVPTVVRELS